MFADDLTLFSDQPPILTNTRIFLFSSVLRKSRDAYLGFVVVDLATHYLHCWSFCYFYFKIHFQILATTLKI